MAFWTGSRVERTCACGKGFTRKQGFIDHCLATGAPVECSYCARNRTTRASIALTCPECQKDFNRTPEYIRTRTQKGLSMTCTSCSNRVAGKEKYRNHSPEKKQWMTEKRVEGSKAYYAGITKEEIQERGRKGGLGNKGGTSAKRQWETVKADPEQYAKACARLRRVSQTTWDARTPEERDEFFRKCLRTRKWGVSASGDRFIDRLSQEGIPLEVEQVLHGFVVDGLDRSRNVIVEFYGDIYHCRPSMFKDPEHYCKWLGRTVGQQWARDRRRLGVFYRFGFRVVIVWESDWSGDPEREIRRVRDAMLEGGTGRER